LRSGWSCARPIVPSVLSILMVGGEAAAQNITVDGRLSPAQTLAGPNYTISASLGRQVGGNLFHSFGKFGLSTAESATFTGPNTVNNIIGRVTGGTPSSIDGRINSGIAGANLYLINPAGIVFGPNATVNLSGSLHVSTADYLKFSDGARFQATNPDGSTLTSAPPAAFGFIGPQPAAITLNGTSLGPVPGTLGLVGGPITASGAQLSAPGGNIRIAAVAVGEVPVEPQSGTALATASFSPAVIQGGSKLSVSNGANGNSGTVQIRASSLAVRGSEIDADTFGSAAIAGQLLIKTDGAAVLDSSNLHALTQGRSPSAGINITSGSLNLDTGSVIDASSVGAGVAGPVAITTGDLTLARGSRIAAGANFSGAGNTVTVAAGNVSISSDSSAAPSSINADSNGNASAGSVNLVAGSLAISGLASRISANAGNRGNAGSVTVNLSGGLLLSSFGRINADGSQAGGTGAPGSVAITASTLGVFSGAAISAAVQPGGTGSGAAGGVTINAGDVTIDGSGAPNLFTGITTATVGSRPGADAGNITVNAQNLSVLNYGEIAAGTFGPGNGGTMTVNVEKALVIDGRNAPMSALTGLGAEADFTALGRGGTILVNAGSLALYGNGEIAGGSLFNGNGGRVSVSIADLLSIDGANATHLAGIAAQGENGTGNAGSLQVRAGRLTIDNNGTISVNTTGSGAGGDVVVSVAGPAALTSGGAITSETTKSGNGGNVILTSGGPLTLSGSGTRIASSAAANATGNAGSVLVNAPHISVSDGAQIASSTAGPGTGGDVAVNSGTDIALSGLGPQVSVQSSGAGDAGTITLSARRLTLNRGAAISTQAATANGGNIVLHVADLLYLTRSKITTSVLGAAGNGGNITIDPQLVVLDHSDIIAQAVRGNGGNITIVASEFIKTPDSVVSASSQLGISGTVELIGPRVDLNGSLVALPSDLRNPAAILRENCAARAGQPRSSLAEAGRGALPQDPEASVPALYFAGRDLPAGIEAGGALAAPALQRAQATGPLAIGCS